ncbi:MAG: sulfatase-like hydrolase/transferase [Dehalococcoidia bacterium]|nr:sulfatase-like hydrolase/transferase [Dehalococcoidia bacterium]
MDKKPNFLVIMSDEHGAQFSSTYGHPIVETPNMDRLAAQGVTFDANYCNSPLCIPSRASFMTGQYVSTSEVWDNSKPMPVDRLTWPYLLRNEGYDTALNGKMHLVGPDPLHGFDRQLSRDPHIEAPLGHFRWSDGIPKATEDWDGVRAANPGVSPMIEADDAMEKSAVEYLSDPARHEKPFAMCVGFIAPHFPFIVPEPYFSKYYPDNLDMPDLPAGHLDDLPLSAQRLRRMFGLDGDWTVGEVARARAAYFGLCTYLDDKIGHLLDTLEEQGLAENTVIVHTSDHGDMLGEHGLWRKMCFYEQSARVPLQISWPGVFSGGQRVAEAVSNVDAVATILELAGIDISRWKLDGQSLLPALNGDTSGLRDVAISEHFAHGTDRAMGMVRSGNWKLCYGHADPPELELYDLDADPGEFTNLAGAVEHAEAQERLLKILLDQWGDPDALTAKIVQDQEDREIVRNVTGVGTVF